MIMKSLCEQVNLDVDSKLTCYATSGHLDMPRVPATTIIACCSRHN